MVWDILEVWKRRMGIVSSGLEFYYKNIVNIQNATIKISLHFSFHFDTIKAQRCRRRKWKSMKTIIWNLRNKYQKHF